MTFLTGTREDAWTAHQRQRWTRPDAQRWLHPDARRWLSPTYVPSRERKYSPDQPRVPAGSPGGGQWTNEGDVDQRTRIRFAGDTPAPLRRIHPDATYVADPKANRSLEFWRQQPTGHIVESLKPGHSESLMASPDGRIRQGNTRIKVLQERGYDVNSLPRVPYPVGPLGPGGSQGGGGPGAGGGRGNRFPFQ